MKFLFASAHCLDDNSSGAALGMQTLLKGLVREGHSAASLSGAIFDTQQAAKTPSAPWQALRLNETADFLKDGVRHTIMGTRHWHRTLLTAVEEEALYLKFRSLLDSDKPDIVITYGGMLLERAMLAEAKKRNIKTVFNLVNPNYPFQFIFDNSDWLITDSQATAGLYKRKFGLNLEVIGGLIDPESYIAERRAPEFITFINPSLEKGASMVARLALMSRHLLPDARFLIVESRGRWAQSILALGLTEADFPNVTVWPAQGDMRLVYARTKVLLLPSFWHESGGRVAVEAMVNGIPVLAESKGGPKELLRGGGVLLDIVDEVRNKKDCLVSEESAGSWFSEIKALLSDQKHYEDSVNRALESAKTYDLQSNVRQFLRIVGCGTAYK